METARGKTDILDSPVHKESLSEWVILYLFAL